ncbi:hypothetical protein B0H11DRAFT_1967129 [Mycena galericulata]|nr:hypothetical protein B0H11DRAFT_1967129 [Mycena galericulata]
MSDLLHEVHFTWPSTTPNVVIVTGTFDGWSSSVHLVKNETGFHGSTLIPYGTKIAYKYVVDSDWVCENTTPTEADAAGHLNNVYTSPPKPWVEPAASDVAGTANGSATEEKALSITPAVADSSKETKSEEPTVTGEAAAQAGATFSQLASDFVDTVVARDGTTSALGYVTSALGATIQSQIGVDPINGEKTAVETPKPDAQFTLPEPATEITPIVAPSPIAPVVPIAIVPVNAEENNTISTEIPTESAVPSTVAPSVPVSEAFAEPERPPVPEPETPSTHSPLPAAIPSSPDAASETLTSSAAVPSVPEVVFQPETKNIEPPPAPSEPPVSPTPKSETAPAPEVVVQAETKTIETPAPSDPPVAVVAEITPLAATASPEAVASPVSDSGKPATNGTAALASPSADAASSSTPVATPTPSAPATPAKSAQHVFPSSDTDSPSSSNNNSPSKFGTVGSRKNRKSIFGKFKGLFSGEKEEKEKK